MQLDSPLPPIPIETMVGLRTERFGRIASQQFILELLNLADAGRSFPLGASVRIGKADDNDIVLSDPTVSRNHLVVRREGDQFAVQDLGSTNGTFINGAQVREAWLRAGALLEVGEVQLRLQPVIRPLQLEPSLDDRLGELVGTSLPMRQIFALMQRIAPTDSTMLLVGETGSGKGAASRTIHRLSGRSSGPFVVFDCASVSENLIESELFGHEKGAFTGAVSQRIGCLERADGGTLFLDEIDDLPLDLQPKLLRALEEREFRRLGQSSGPAHRFDTRVIAASKKDLWTEAKADRFREDLYFRLSVFTVTLPSLRDRKEDLPSLVNALAAKPLWEALSNRQRSLLLDHTWPGNVRELRNAVERLKHVADLPEVMTEGLLLDCAGPATMQGEMLPVTYTGHFKELKEEMVLAFEREYLTRLLATSRRNIAKAARAAGIDRKSLYYLLKKHRLEVQEEPVERPASR